MPPTRTLLKALLQSTALAWAPAHASGLPFQAPSDLTELSLEDLMLVEVQATAAGRKAQSVAETAAAVHVLTADDIRRSGATSLPEVLRLIPGVHVARIGAYEWAISARGFNDQYANKMQVLVDGRSVYTPLFSGAYWDTLDLPLENIERVEVVLGPGAVLWGANAVNGVISIVTKSAHATQGQLISALAGSEAQGIGLVRQGGRIGADGAYRVWARYAAYDESLASNGSEAMDDWQGGQLGFRTDWHLGERDDLSVQGGYYALDENFSSLSFDPAPPFTALYSGNTEPSGAFLLGRWTRDLGEDSSLDIQASADTTTRESPGFFGEARDTFDFDLQHRFQAGARNDVIWGVGFRSTESQITEQSFPISYSDDHRQDQLLSVFAQDDISLLSERWNLVLGAKLENSEQMGTEFQPNLRTHWQMGRDQMGWASVSRAVRSPNQSELDGLIPLAVIPGAPPTVVMATGDDQFESEELVAWELGYRNRLSQRLSLDVATFFNVYDDLRTLEPGVPFLQGGVVIQPLSPRNLGSADTWGGEVALDWLASERMRVRASYSLLEIDYSTDPVSGDTTSGALIEDSAPQNQASLWVNCDLASNWDLDAALFYVDGLVNGDIPSYLRLDLRAEWRPSQDWRLVLGAQGLFHDSEPEFGSGILSTPEQVQEAFYAQLAWSR